MSLLQPKYQHRGFLLRGSLRIPSTNASIMLILTAVNLLLLPVANLEPEIAYRCMPIACRYADKTSMELGLLFTCRLGNVDLDRPVGLLQKKDEIGSQTTMEATLMAQQSPGQREQVLSSNTVLFR